MNCKEKSHGESCSVPALEGQNWCHRHSVERLAKLREWEAEILASLKERAGRLVELDLQLDALREEQRRERQEVLGYRWEIDKLAEALGDEIGTEDGS